MAEGATCRCVTHEFFASHSVAELTVRGDYWLGRRGRPTHPVSLEEGASHCSAIEWHDAFELIAQEIGDMNGLDEAVFHTSDGTSNEAAFVCQLLMRDVGTRNFPDCSNGCLESFGVADEETIGIDEGSVSPEDLETAKKNGAPMVPVKPLPKDGILRFENLQSTSGRLVGTQTSDDFLQIRAGARRSLFQWLGNYLFEAEAHGRNLPGLPAVVDHDFINNRTVGMGACQRQPEAVRWA